MDKKDQKKIIGIGILIVIVLVFLIGWIINIDSPTQALSKNQHTVIARQHISNNDSTTIKSTKKNHNKTASNHHQVIK